MTDRPGLVERFILPVHRAGWPIIAVAVVVTLLLFLVARPLGWLAVIVTLVTVYFFRDPPRVTPTRPGLVVSGADGVVEEIARAAPPPELEMGPEERWRVSIFLSLFDVHVNRVPVDGVVTRRIHRPGRFHSAERPEASGENERSSTRFELADGRDLVMVQIAGLVARRIVCDLSEGARVRAGERLGIIRFGSRVDHYLPAGVAPLVAVGQRAVGGETVIADLESGEPPRHGEKR